MSVRRLTDADKRQIVDLYRTPGETAATLAEQFGVSNTTIGRILKAGIDVKEYDQIVQQKRRGHDHAVLIPATPIEALIPVSTPEPTIEAIVEVAAEPIASIQSPDSPATTDQRRSRRRSSAPIASESDSIAPPAPVIEPNIIPEPDVSPEPEVIPEPALDPAKNLEFFFSQDELEDVIEPLQEKTKKVIQVGIRSADEPAKRSNDRPVRRFEPSFEEEDDDDDDENLLPPVTEEIAAIMEEDFGEDEDDEADDLADDEDDEDLEDEGSPSSAQEMLSLQVANLMRVRPFEEADMPRTCYLVIDRAAELVVRPLGDFGDLSSLPEAQRTMTLPIFDDHRVAKRFATDRTQRVIKVPDSQIFHKTAYQLRSKGITHLFVDGQVYSL